MSFAERLKYAAEEKGVNQADLAGAVGTSRAAVSGWFRGTKQPTSANVAALADALGVGASWLQYGEGQAPSRDLELDRKEYRDRLRWYWRPAPPDHGRQLGDPAGFAFDVDMAALARETGQNSVDALMDGEATIDFDVTVIELEGDELATFLTALRIDELTPHLDAASRGDQKAAGVIRAGIDALFRRQKLMLIRIADYNAHGLIGGEYDPGLFTAVCRNTLDSQKASDTAGGSYGLGKATMWTSSSMGLVITNSTLSRPLEGRYQDRLFARIELPWHQLDDESFAGPGWLGELDEERGCTRSYWGNAALALDLHVARDGAEPGTTFLIVAAFDPSGSVQTTEEIARELERSLAVNFWPAMVGREPAILPRLRARVRTQKGRQQISDRLVDPSDYAGPLVEALLKHFDDDVVESLDQPGDVVRRTVLLRVPERVGDDRHPASDQSAVVLVAQASDPADGGQPVSVNRVTRFRGNSMVIEESGFASLPFGARPFHAIVLAGEAAGSTPEDRRAERFLRAAEPPAHNRWTSTAEVTSKYKRGARKALDDFREAVRGVVRDVVQVQTEVVSDGPESLKQLLRLVPPLEPHPKKPRIKEPVHAVLDEDGVWGIEATVIVPASDQGWHFRPVLRFGTESGPPLVVQWQVLEAVAGCDVVDSKLLTRPRLRSAKFQASSDTSTYPVSAARVRVSLDLHDVGEEGRRR